MDMTGQDIKDLIDQQFAGGNGILQIPSTLTYTRDGNGVLVNGVDTPAGDTASNIMVNGEALDLTRVYRVTVNNFLADGGDGYSVLRRGTNRYVGEIDLDAFARYVEMLGTVNPGPQNRITYIP